jgi:4,5-DOPA dioxygenase extradiol
MEADLAPREPTPPTVFGVAATGAAVVATEPVVHPRLLTETRLQSRPVPAKKRMPTIFVAHGAPPLLDIEAWVNELAAWGRALPKPKSILMLSAHWEQRPITLGATRTAPLVYDFYGFPQKYYEQQYAAPGAPDVARRVKELLGAMEHDVVESERGLDHGAYVPLVAMYPQADVPVVQLSLPSLEGRELFALGKTLAPLRDEGVLIVGSGFLTHNLRHVDFGPEPATPAWAEEFDAWVADALIRRDVEELVDFERRAPAVEIALPTTEHYVPVLAALGAAADETKVEFPITGFWAGSLTRRSVQFG